MVPSLTPATTANIRNSRRLALCAHVVRTGRKAADFPVLAMLLSLPSGAAMLGQGAHAAELTPARQSGQVGIQATSQPESMVVHIQPRPPIQIYPHANVNAVSKFPTCAVGKFPSTDMVISH